MQSTKNIMTIFNYPAFIVLTAFTVLSVSAAGQPVLKIGNYAGCTNKQILVPVEISDMNNVVALTLYIKVDTNSVGYVGLENVNSVFLTTGSFVGNLSDGVIILSWFSTTPVTLNDGVMCELNLLLKENGQSAFHFKQESEFIKPDLSVIEGVEYIDGSLVAVSEIQPYPASLNATENSVVNVFVTEFDNDFDYHWQINSGDDWEFIEDNSLFSGSNTSNLQIHVTNTINGADFRCVMSNENCTATTHNSSLTVIPNGVIEETSSYVWEVFPNPFNDNVNVRINNHIERGLITITDMLGKQLLSEEVEGDGTVNNIDVSGLKSGVYFISLLDDNEISIVKKIIRN